MDKQNALETRRMLIGGADCRCRLDCFGGCRQQQPIAIEASHRTANPACNRCCGSTAGRQLAPAPLPPLRAVLPRGVCATLPFDVLN